MLKNLWFGAVAFLSLAHQLVKSAGESCCLGGGVTGDGFMAAISSH